jgi:hypothetical protein
MKNLLAAACGLTLALVAPGPARLLAQEAVLEQLYGNGVHRYFAGDYSQAVAELTAAIDGGSQDPRAYYFRGLARLRSGGDAAADFQRGAAMETADTNQYYPVGRSLERVQGATRMSLERYRALARATALSRQQRREAERYDQLRRSETHVLRPPVAAPPTAASAVAPAPATVVPAVPKAAIAQPAAPKSGVPQPPVPQPPAAEDPFADEGAANAAAEPAKAKADAAEDAAAPAAEQEPKTEDMPAEEPAAEPAEAAPAEEAAKTGEAKDAEQPAADPAKADEEDPFAENPPK